MSLPLTSARQDWMRTLALAQWAELKSAAAHLTDVAHDFMRAPETGLVMLRGRMGGSGAAFNVGEATVTRCSVRLPGNVEGHAYVMGRNPEHARLAAICDALLQQTDHHEAVMDQIVRPLAEIQKMERLHAAQTTAATKVDFFTLVRGDV